jgi:CDP-diacylglycerol--glycerol-3-phosphate 3-phosphatidyltransferase
VPEIESEAIALAATLLVLVASMPVFARTARNDERVARVHGDRSSFLIGPFVVGWFYWLIGPVVRASAGAGVGPFFFNLAGLALGISAGVLFALGASGMAGWAILVGGIADILDGNLARTTGVSSTKGAFIDSSLDRFSETASFVGLAIFLGSSATVQLFLSSALGGSLLVSYTRARGESLGVACRGGIMQRPQRVLLLGFGGILDPTVSSLTGHASGAVLVPVLLLIAVGTMATAIYRTVWIARELQAAAD